MRRICFGVLFGVLFSQCLFAQYYGDLSTLDTVPAYTTGNASTFVEYNEMTACVDSLHRISILSIENYTLKLYESPDSGNTWTKTALTTGDEGDFWTAMMTCTPEGKRIIFYGANPYQNYGANLDPYSTYFNYGCFGYVETGSGWVKTTVSPVVGGNSGLIPFAIHRARNGLIYCFMHQRGWYTYGGYIHQVIYNPATNVWGSPSLIYGYSQTVDRMTTGFAKVMEDTLGNLSLVYRKQSPSGTGSIYELAILRQNNGSWTSVSPFLLSANYPTSYWTYDNAVDDEGNVYFTYLANPGYGPNGPGIILGKNELSSDTVFAFSSTDTLQALTFIEPAEGEPFLQIYLKNVGKRYYRYDPYSQTLQSLILPYFPEPGDSTLYYSYAWVPWPIKRSANFSGGNDIYLVQKESKGRDPVVTSTVLPQPYRFTRLYIPLSTEARILRFSIPGMITSLIDTAQREILVVMPAGTNFSSLTPDTILVSEFASVSPGVGVAQNFSNPVIYTVTAQDNSVQLTWEVSVVDNTGIADANDVDIRIIPNPARQYVRFNGPGSGPVMIYDANGKVVLDVRSYTGQSLDISGLHPGIYLVAFPSVGGRQTGLLVVDR